MALENDRVLETLKGRKEELEKNMQELNVQMQSISNTLLRVAGAIDVLEQIEESKLEFARTFSTSSLKT